MTIFNPPKHPVKTETEISGLDAVKEIRIDGMFRPMRSELILRGYTYFNRADGRMIKLELKRDAR